MLTRLLSDFSFSAFTAGFIAVLVGFASAMAIVFQAATAAGADQSMIESWIWALGLGMGISSIGLSIWYKRPIIIAWSTPGAALLATSLTNSSMEQAVGIFLFVGLLILIVGVTGWFAKLTNAIPLPIAAAMLAGILVQFGIAIFTSMQSSPLMVGVMIATYLLAKLFLPRYAIALVLVVGVTIAYFQQSLDVSALSASLAMPIFVTPEFSFNALIGIGIPLFVVTMTSQNLPGVATLKASGYEKQPVSPLISVTGITTLLFAPFGGFTFNLAAITAAICTSEESHPDPKKRYIAGVSSGAFNIIAGVFGSALVGLFAAFPITLVSALAGLALVGAIGSSLNSASESSQYREAAILTFLVTASGMTFFGIASAFWGLAIGMLTVLLSPKLAVKR